MQRIPFGRTGLEVSKMALGAGGHSRLGLSQDKGEANAASVIRAALDAGVNYIDTAESYTTEPVIGKTLAELGRDDVILSTKKSLIQDDNLISPQQLRDGCEQSLRNLHRDCIDIYNLHGLRAKHYQQAAETLVPELFKLRNEGKIRFLGVTEYFIIDPGHDMLQMAIRDDWADVMMVGFNLLNPSARQRVFPTTMRKGIATQIMFAVRRALSRPDALRELVGELIERDEIPAAEIDIDNPLGFLLEGEGASASIPEAAYRFALHEPGADIVLVGTGNVEHLRENLSALDKGPLPPSHLAKLRAIFGRVDSVSGN